MSAPAVENRRPAIGMAVRAGAVTFGGQALLSAAAAASLAELGRLIARGRVPRGMAALTYSALLEVPHFIMQRRMLLGIKSRAEAPSGAMAGDP